MPDLRLHGNSHSNTPLHQNCCMVIVETSSSAATAEWIFQVPSKLLGSFYFYGSTVFLTQPLPYHLSCCFICCYSRIFPVSARIPEVASEALPKLGQTRFAWLCLDRCLRASLISWLDWVSRAVCLHVLALLFSESDSRMRECVCGYLMIVCGVVDIWVAGMTYLGILLLSSSRNHYCYSRLSVHMGWGFFAGLAFRFVTRIPAEDRLRSIFQGIAPPWLAVSQFAKSFVPLQA
ncbi:hypothetical protein BKA65DRAFT_223582 [Rhexocercosporidium sp. MPI-PUGE-AT-0058]|nr:hypothetical protein BKA65DRAFT_223582 [Rhexocercosporidium sp. MPI-PUGE-AT-0058]